MPGAQSQVVAGRIVGYSEVETPAGVKFSISSLLVNRQESGRAVQHRTASPRKSWIRFCDRFDLRTDVQMRYKERS